MKRHWMICVLLVWSVMDPWRAAGGDVASLPGISILRSDEEGILIDVRVEDYTIQPSSVEGFQEIHIPGYRYTMEPGQPMLPIRGVLLGIPPDVDTNVEVVASEGVPRSVLRIVPFPRVDVETDIDETTGSLHLQRWRETVEVDREAYERNAFRPLRTAEVTMEGFLRHQRVVRLTIRPVQYNPAEGMVRIYTHLRVWVRFTSFPSRRLQGKTFYERPSEGDERLFEGMYQHLLLNYEEARRWRTKGARSLSRPAEDWYDPSRVYYKIPVAEDGVYALDASWFRRTGVDPRNVDPRTVQVFHLGAEVPLDVEGGEDGTLDTGDRILFWGTYRRGDRDFESLYGRDDVYWLTWGGPPGRRVSRQRELEPGPLPLSPFYYKTVHVEQDIRYEALGYAVHGNRDHWFWKMINSSDGKSFSVVLDRVVFEAREPVLLRVALHGLTALSGVDPDHHAIVSINGHEVGDHWWDGQSEFIGVYSIPVSYLKEGENRVEVRVPAGTGDRVFDQVLFNWFEVTYPRRYVASGGMVQFEEPGSSTPKRIRVQGFSVPDMVVLDVTRGVRIFGVVDSVASLHAESRSYTVSFSHSSAEPVRYVALGRGAVRTPQRAVRDVPSRLRDPDQGADYVIITHRDFVERVKPLARWREEHNGFEVAVVDVQDIYDEFGWGRFDPEAIRRFLSFTFKRWRKVPSFVLLAGDETWDYRGRLPGSQRRSFVPTLYFHSSLRGEAATDNLLVAVSGEDDLPDMVVGRLPFDQADGAARMVEKIIAYERTPERGPWRGRVLYLGSEKDPSVDFPALLDRLKRTYTDPIGIHSWMMIDTIPKNKRLDLIYPESWWVIDRLNEGVALLNYVGHGSSGMMGNLLISTSYSLGLDYMGPIRNGGKLPLFLGWSCMNAMFAEPSLVSIAEEMVAKPDGGAIGYFAGTTYGWVYNDAYLNELIFQRIFEDGERIVGTLLTEAKIAFAAENSNYRDTVNGFVYIGDPATRLAVADGPDYAVFEEDVRVEALDGGTIVKGTPVTVRVTVRNIGLISEQGGWASILGDPVDDRADTLWHGWLQPFAVVDSLTVRWEPSGPSGWHTVVIRLDERDQVREMDEDNNEVRIRVKVEPGYVPKLAYPLVDGTASSIWSTLVLRDGGRERDVNYRFRVGSTPSFDTPPVTLSGVVRGMDGIATWRVGALRQGETYFWQARTEDAYAQTGWSLPRAFTVDTTYVGPHRWWQRSFFQLQTDVAEGAVLSREHGWRMDRSAQPFKPGEQSWERSFVAEGVEGTGVLCTDGRFLYVKRWFDDPSTIYPGDDYFAVIGTGYGGTVEGKRYGRLGTKTTGSVSAAVHGDGYLYNDSQKAYTMERISPETGVLEVVEVPDGLLERWSGEVKEGHSLITSDGTYVYNVAFSVGGGRFNGWTVKVFKPEDHWRVVRTFVVPSYPTRESFYTDGLLADGEYLYFIEYGGSYRIRRVSALDGTYGDEWHSDQARTNVITGQYDPVNNRVWLGDLLGNKVYRYPGRGYRTQAMVRSPVIGPARRWGTLQWEAVLPGPTSRIQMQVFGRERMGGTEMWRVIPGFSRLIHADGEDLSGIDATVYREIKVAALLEDTKEHQTPSLRSWAVSFEPLEEPPSMAVQEEDQTPPEVIMGLWESLSLSIRPLVEGDFVPPDARFRVQVRDDREVGWEDVRIDLDGEEVSSDAVSLVEVEGREVVVEVEVGTEGMPLQEGVHVLRVEARDRAGNGPTVEKVSFRVSSRLQIVGVLNFPNPTSGETTFWWQLSGEAEVTLRVYTLSGRLIRRIEHVEGAVGTNQLPWDGLDEEGNVLANGVYLYRIRARRGREAAEVTERLAVVR